MKRSERGNFSQLGNDVVFVNILQFLDYQWILNVGRLLSKEWDENCRNSPSFEFPINFRDTKKLEHLMKKQSNALNYATFYDQKCVVADIIVDGNRGGLELLISKMKNLKGIVLKGCAGVEMDEVVKLEKLERVYLHGMFFEHVFKIVKSKSKIKSLGLFGINKVDQILCNIDWNLKELVLHLIDLPEEGWISILERKSCNELENLSLGDCNLPITNNVFERLANLTRLKSLRAPRSKFQDNISFLSNLSNLEILELTDNEITGSGCPNFENLTNLKHLELNRNQIGTGDNHLISMINLTHLELTHNFILDEFLKDFHILKHLKFLDLSFNEIEDSGANYLSNNTSLTHLDLYRNNISGEGVSNFGNLQSLKYLNLTQNKIGKGIIHLTKCKNLTNLLVRGNGIGEDIMDVDFTNLTELNISKNSIGNEAFASLASLPKLEIIKAGNCGIGDEGIVQFFQTLSKRNPPPKSISLSIVDNRLLSNVTLKQCIKHKQLIRKLTISRNCCFKEKHIEKVSKDMDVQVNGYDSRTNTCKWM